MPRAPVRCPQGACTSPALSNLIARRLDSRLAGIAAKLGWQYTRYADDLSFSADAEAEPEKMTGYLLARIRHIAQDEGFVVNEKKTRVLKRSSAMAVTGIIVNRRPGRTAPRSSPPASDPAQCQESTGSLHRTASKTLISKPGFAGRSPLSE